MDKNSEKISCHKAGEAIPIEDAALMFNGDCDPHDCIQFFTCMKYMDDKETNDG